jgi:hypothetical protein
LKVQRVGRANSIGGIPFASRRSVLPVVRADEQCASHVVRPR